MMRPQPRSRMPGASAWTRKNGAERCRSIWRRQVSGVTSSNGWRRLTPAALTRMSTCPSRSRACAALAAMAAGSARSAERVRASMPRAASRAAAPSSSGWRRASSSTRAPARPSAVAMASPRPELPPVTSAVLPARPNISGTGDDAGATGRPGGFMAWLPSAAAMEYRSRCDAARRGACPFRQCHPYVLQGMRCLYTVASHHARTCGHPAACRDIPWMLRNGSGRHFPSWKLRVSHRYMHAGLHDQPVAPGMPGMP